MSRLRIVCLIALVAVAAGGCLSLSPPPKAYLLTAAAPSAAPGAATNAAIGVGPVTIPAYLDRSPIVVRTGADEVRLSEEHYWAEPLGDAVPRTLGENLSAMIPTDAVAFFPWRTPQTVQYRVTMDILRFDGALGGTAILHARWRLLDGEGHQLVLRAVQLQDRSAEATYTALVAAQSRLLAALSQDIAAEIRTRLR